MSKKAMRHFKSESKANKTAAFEDFIKEMIKDELEVLVFLLSDFESEPLFNPVALDRHPIVYAEWNIKRGRVQGWHIQRMLDLL